MACVSGWSMVVVAWRASGLNLLLSSNQISLLTRERIPWPRKGSMKNKRKQNDIVQYDILWYGLVLVYTTVEINLVLLSLVYCSFFYLRKWEKESLTHLLAPYRKLGVNTTLRDITSSFANRPQVHRSDCFIHALSGRRSLSRARLAKLPGWIHQ